MEESPAKKFAKWMSERREKLGITLDILEARTGIKKQHLSTLERAVPHSLTGKPVTPKRPTVEKIAKGLESPANEALAAAGYIGEIKTLEEKGAAVQLVDELWLSAEGLDEETKEKLFNDVRAIVKAMIGERKKEN